MRKIILAAGLALGCALLGGCNLTTASIQADETTVAAVVAAAKSKSGVSVSSAQSAIQVVCSWASTLDGDAQTLSGLVGSAASGSKVAAYLKAANTALDAANTLCNSSGNPISLLISGWNAYQTAKTALVQAQAAAQQ